MLKLGLIKPDSKRMLKHVQKKVRLIENPLKIEVLPQ